MSRAPQIPDSYHKFFAGWVRIEPRCRSDDFSKGLEACTADPLWFLGRQWQLGEFAAEDAGSPINVEVSHRTRRLSRLIVRSADGTEKRVELGLPIETLIEQESVETLRRQNETTQEEELTWDWRLRVRVGQQFERLCRGKLGNVAPTVIGVYRGALGITAASGQDLLETDRATQRFRQLMAGRVVDGWRLRKAREQSVLPATSGDLTPVFDALDAWWKQLFTQPDTDAAAWRPERLEYEFEVQAPMKEDDGVALSAPSYRNGDFDWHSCLVKSESAAAWAVDEQKQEYPPTRVTFAGMPHPRWWAFEDSQTDFGALDVATPDIAKLALMEFALIYGDDWFMVPLGVPLGSLTKITRLQVTDVFGQVVRIDRARTPGASALSRWEMYALAREKDEGDGGGAEFLFVPPAVGFREESEPNEEVLFLRDEGANMVWGVEHRVPNGVGNPVDGFDAQTERRARQREQGGSAPPLTPAAAPADITYGLATTVPANWMPFMPADASLMLPGRSGAGIPSVRLLRAQMLSNEPAEPPKRIPAMSRLLDLDRSNPVLWLDEEAVPREGVKVQLTKQRVRWTNGETYVWLGKKVLVGRGEGRSGLRFDVVK